MTWEDTSLRSTDSEFPDCSNQTAHLDSDSPVHVNPKFNQFSPNLAGNYCDTRHGKLSVQKVKEEMDLAKFKPDPERPRIFMSKNGKVVIVFPNGEIVEGKNNIHFCPLIFNVYKNKDRLVVLCGLYWNWNQLSHTLLKLQIMFISYLKTRNNVKFFYPIIHLWD